MTHQRDTKGVRQVLLQYRAELSQGLNELAGHGTAEEQAEATLQEIMLGMLPEESHTCITHKHLPCAGCTVQLMEQNIRGGFNNG